MMLVSACLLGVNCKYNGENNRNEKVLEYVKGEKDCVIPVCPEQLGGLPTPRNQAVVPEGGESVVDGDGKVIMKGWGDVTSKFLKGARETLKLAEIYDVDRALLKTGSPSCGHEMVSKDFSEKKKGMGVTAALLKRNGIKIISEKDL